MSGTGQGEWFADTDGQWTWRQPDGSCWRQGAGGSWQPYSSAGSVPEQREPVGIQVGSALPGSASPPGPSFGFQHVGTGSVASLTASLPQPPHPGPPPPGAVGIAGQLGDPQQWSGSPETSAMAVWALVLAIIPLCYVTQLIGIVLGLEARHHIKHSHGMLRGKTPAALAVVIGLAWFVTVPILFHNGIDAYRSATATSKDYLTQKALGGVMTAASDIEQTSKSYATATLSTLTDLPSIPGLKLSPACQYGAICVASGNGSDYSYFEECEITGSNHVWVIAATSAGAKWYGFAVNSCPTLGDPGSAANQPVQGALWRTGGFPGVQFHFQWQWKF